MAANFQSPRWLRDLERFLPLKSQFVLSGNVRDLQAFEVATETVIPHSFNETLAATLRRIGYSHCILYDPVGGFRQLLAPGADASKGEELLAKLGLQVVAGKAQGGADLLASTMSRVVDEEEGPIALIVDFASQLMIRRDALSAPEHHLFTQALILSHRSKARPCGKERKPYFNTIIWVVEREGDLPDWMIIDNPRIRLIPVSKPDHVARRALAPALLKPLEGFAQSDEPTRSKAISDFIDGTEGLLLLDLNAIAILARVEGVPLVKIADAVRRYKVGVTEDPWQKLDHQKIRGADSFIRERVKGQDAAVLHMLDLVKRAVTGVGGRRGNRPRGVAFLAGPTGVGKTELAKAVTSLLFGDDSAYIRFDMSEFSAEHSDQRLIGAPPGYVGYDAGGELTNAVREKPFSVVLFDEIEKAHPRILDKFLQILDDGVLTSGRGDRVYFSETLIVFTSNLGIYRVDELGRRVPNVSSTDSLEVVKDRVTTEIQNHFKLVLNRPEILNRIGENVIVFDFIREDIAAQIFAQMVGAILSDLRDKGFHIGLHSTATSYLRDQCLRDLSNGGRGIRNQLEIALVNPLARKLFDEDAEPGSSFELHYHVDGALELVRV